MSPPKENTVDHYLKIADRAEPLSARKAIRELVGLLETAQADCDKFARERLAAEKRAMEAEGRAAEAVDYIELILPMAKGYAAVNNVGSNREYVRSAEEFCRAFPQEQTDG